jgi:hypothetical protein
VLKKRGFAVSTGTNGHAKVPAGVLPPQEPSKEQPAKDQQDKAAAKKPVSVAAGGKKK